LQLLVRKLQLSASDYSTFKTYDTAAENKNFSGFAVLINLHFLHKLQTGDAHNFKI